MASIVNRSADERRQNQQYRQIFENVYDRVEPFLDPANSWSGQPLEFLAYGVLRENYPQLSSDELNAFFVATKRAFKERNFPH